MVNLDEAKKEKYADLALRVGIAGVLLWSVKTKFTTPDKVANMIGSFGLTFMNASLVMALGVVLAVIAVCNA